MSKIGLINSLNAIRQDASTKYQNSVPEITEKTSIAELANPILDNSALYNEFCNALVQRIVYTQVQSKIYNNPLKSLEGDNIPLGYLGQEIFINPAQGRDYDINDFAGLLKKYEADVKVQYQEINFDKQYPVTVIRQKLKQAFTSFADLEAFITGYTNSLYNGLYIDEYNATKGIVTNAYLSNAVQIVKIEKPTTKELAEDFVEKARTLFLNFQTPSSNYNAWHKVGGYGRDIVTFTSPEDIVFLLRNDLRSKLDVKVLAESFNMDKSILLGNILPVDDFSVYDSTGKLLKDGSDIYGIIADKSWFRIKTQDEYTESFNNGNNRSINYYLNKIKMFNYSFFANAIVFATKEPELPINSLDFKAETIEIEKTGDTEGLDITVNPVNATTPKITYASDNEAVFTVLANAENDRHCTVTATGAGTANLTATAGNVTTKVQITVKA